MLKRILALSLCVLMFAVLLPAAALAEDAVDYITVTIQKGDNVKKLLEQNGRDYQTDKYVVMVLNGWDREYKMETLTIGNTIKIPRSPDELTGFTPHLISSDDTIEYFVIPYAIQQGDSLKRVYSLWGLRVGDYLDAISALNGAKDLDLLYVGDIYLLPTTEKNLRTDVYTTVMSHIMLDGETVEEVYSHYGIDCGKNREHLQSYNVKSFDEMRPGDKLLIPLG